MFKVENVAEMYKKVGSFLLDSGDIVCPRGKETREIVAPVIHIENPRDRLAYLPERKYNIIFALSESVMLFSDSNKARYFSKFNKNMANFSDDGINMYGSYGTRIAEYIPVIVDKLKEDKDSRQAILTIYTNDCGAKTKDIPCTLNLHFLVRNGKLNLIVYMRSNDIIWGTSYDIFMFTMLQETIANELEMDMGWYKHIPSSLHVYDIHYDLLRSMKACTNVQLRHDMKVADMFQLSRIYRSLVDEKVYIELQNMKIRPFINLFENEIKYIDSGKDAKSCRFNANIPEELSIFVKRWGCLE